MISKEEIEKAHKFLVQLEKEGYKYTANGREKFIIENVFRKIDQLETREQKLIETNEKYLQKLVYALTPTTHELSTDNNNAFKRIIAENIDLETCKIRRKLKEFWGIDKY